jgi:aquaporin Z
MVERPDATLLGPAKGSTNPLHMHALVAEFLGTFFIEFFTGAITVVSATTGLVTGAMGIGFSFVSMMFIFRGVSGAHLNPAVTIGVMASSPPLSYEFNLIQGLAYIFCQLFGSVTGAVMVSHLIPMEADIIDEPATEDSPAVHHKGSVTFMTRGVLSGDHGLSVFIFELVCTFAIVWAYFATMIDTRSRRRTGGFGPVAVGLGIIVGVLAEGPGTGGLFLTFKSTRTLASTCFLHLMCGHICSA